MVRIAIFTLLLGFTLPLFATPTQGAIVRVARRYSVMDFYGSSSSPVGKYDNIGGMIYFVDGLGRPVEIDGDEIYDPTYQLGLSYGQVTSNQMLLKIGFRYTKIEVSGNDPLFSFVSLHQYDLDVNFNYLLMNIIEKSFAPYVGVGLRAGFTNAEASGFSSTARFNTVLAANAGVELKVWEDANKRSFVTLASVNSYDLYASGDRPKYLNIGAAIKYYFRP